MPWRVPSFNEIRDLGLRNIIQSLESFLKKPRFEQGIEIGGGFTGYNAAADVKTFQRPVLIDGKAATSPFTPVLTATTTNPTLGSGGSFTQAGFFVQIGDLVFYTFQLRFGTVGPAAGSGTYRISLPVNARIYGPSNIQPIAAEFRLRDNSAAVEETHAKSELNATFLQIITQTAFDGGIALMSNAVPWTWAASDLIWGGLVYLAEV